LFDLYREEELDPSLLEFCLYMAFWPTVASGPVARLPNMLPQFRQTSTAVGEDFSVGAVRIVQGIFMKFVLAHLLNVGLTPEGGVTAGFDEISPLRSGPDAWALAIGYGFQIFFDFAGYTSIVIGAARLMGIRLPENFDQPYLSTAPSIFWTRWHMSLSFWIRDYVFMPLAIVRRDPWWPYVAVIISMVTFGLWHGPKLTFIAWGLYNGLLLVGHRMGQKLKKRISIKLPHPVGILFSWASTFLLISLGYIFFRSNNLTQALQLWRAILTPRSYYVSSLSHDYYLLVGLIVAGYFASAGIAQIVNLCGCYSQQWRIRFEQAPPHTLARRVNIGGALVMTENLLVSKKWWVLTPILVLISIVTTLSFFGQSSSIAPFIYARF
jgi:alginate O-acetyltransferase complex protein AlgI